MLTSGQAQAEAVEFLAPPGHSSAVSLIFPVLHPLSTYAQTWSWEDKPSTCLLPSGFRPSGGICLGIGSVYGLEGGLKNCVLFRVCLEHG